MILFWLFWSINALVTLTAIYFFFAGWADGSVSPDNLHLWVFLLGALAGILAGSIGLKNRRRTGWASALVIVPALPVIGFAFSLLVAVLTGERWN